MVPRRIFLIATVILIGIILYIYSYSIITTFSHNGSIELSPVEVRDYQGSKLSSINDFRENSIRGPQYIEEETYRLKIGGFVNESKEYTYGEVLEKFQHYTKVVTLYCVEGWDVTILWEGVMLRDLLMDAGINPQAKTVILTAHDGYTTSFPIEYLTNRDIIMAYQMNNVTLSKERGYPFQLVAEEKLGYKWIKWIERIDLFDDTNYRGYWESRGYSNNGSLTRSFFD